MSNFTSTKAVINAAIKANGNNEITGPVLNGILTTMVNNLGDGYRFAGIVSPSDEGLITDNRVFVMATEVGTYTNFGGLTVSAGELAIFTYRTSWIKQAVTIATGPDASKIDKVTTAVANDIAVFVTGGGLADSGMKLSDISAAIAAKYSKPSGGIPASDLASAVQTSLGKADTSVQPAGIADFITRSVNDLANYYLKTETYTQSEVNALIATIKQFTYEVVAVLPAASASTMNKIYLVPASRTEAQNVKDEYITIDHGAEAETRYTWEQIGSTAIDLSAYSTTAQMNAAIAAYHDSTKQDVISDLVAIRAGAAAGATAYQKPASGIPSTDLSSAVQTSLGKADTALQSVPATYRTAAAQDEIDEMKADKDGYYSSMTVGASENIVGRGSVNAKYTYRASGGSQSIGSGAAILKSIKGNAVVMNQLVRNGDTEKSNSTGTAYSAIQYSTSATNDVDRHKYYLSVLLKGKATGKFMLALGNASTGSTYFLGLNQNTFTRKSVVITKDDTNSNFIVYDIDGSGETSTVKNAVCIDLTLMFGAGNEPQTASEFEALFPLDYYAYNAGAVIGNKTTGIKTNGFNQLNPSTIVDGKIIWSTGQEMSNDNYAHSDYIKVVPSSTYYFKDVLASYQNNSIALYDQNKTFINIVSPIGSSVGTETDSGTYTIPSNVGYIIVNLWKAKKDIACVNLSHSGYRNGEYEEFWENTKTLNLPTLTGKAGGQGTSVTIFPEGMMSAGSVHDEIQFSRLGVATKAIKRIGKVDLGGLDWYYVSALSLFIAEKPSDCKSSNGTTANCACGKYTAIGINSGFLTSDKVINIGAEGYYVSYICVKDSSYTDAAAFKTAMSGVYLYYELATPIEYTLDAELNGIYAVDDFGTEMQLPQNTGTPTTAPLLCDVQYAMNAEGEIRNLPKNYASIAPTASDSTIKNLLTAMQSAGVIAGFTIAWDNANQRYTFTITPTA